MPDGLPAAVAVAEAERRASSERIVGRIEVKQTKPEATMSHRANRIVGMRIRDRWMAEIKYLDGTQDTVLIEEIEDLDEIVELGGKDWHTIDVIEIRLNRPAVDPKNLK
jgi:hypothetical protein